MFWKVAGFSTPSPIEQILDKEEFTLEELLQEGDIIQECKSLNGRLIAFLRERSTVEQLLRFLVEPAADNGDPNSTYKYPFTACEVFCCEVEAVFNTLLEDPELMRLLFSLLQTPAPLDSKTAGYFGRVVGHLLLRKTNELMQYLQEQPEILESFINHVDTTSIADIVKRLIGADEQSSMLFIPAYAQWLSSTPLVELLLQRLSPSHSAEAQANAADILSAIANTQPSPLATKLTKEECISALFTHALIPGQHVLVPALDVCIALVEPKRSVQVDGSTSDSGGAVVEAVACRSTAVEAVSAIVQHLPKLVQLLVIDNGAAAAAADASTAGPDATATEGAEDGQGQKTGESLETPYGLLTPPLGRMRLKVVELLAVLMRSSEPLAEGAMIQTPSLSLCMDLFRRYPFNNLLHHSVTAMLVAALTKPCSPELLQHLFTTSRLLDWLITLPSAVTPTPIPLPAHAQPQASTPTAKAPLRAGYLGHVTQIASTLEEIVARPLRQDAVSVTAAASIRDLLAAHEGWQAWRVDVLGPRLEVENTSKWACGRPAATDLGHLDSDNDEYANEMDLEQQQPALYHRYNVDEGDEEEEDEDGGGAQDSIGTAWGAEMITEAILGMDLTDRALPDDDGEDDGEGAEQRRPTSGNSQGEGGHDYGFGNTSFSDPEQRNSGGSSGGGSGNNSGPTSGTSAVEHSGSSMEMGGMQAWDDEVLLATSDDDESFDSPHDSLTLEAAAITAADNHLPNHAQHLHDSNQASEHQHSNNNASSSMATEEQCPAPTQQQKQQEQSNVEVARGAGMSSHPLVGAEESCEASLAGSEVGEAEDMVIVEDEGNGPEVAAAQGSPPGAGVLAEGEGAATSPYNDHNYWNKHTWGAQVPDEA